MRRLLTGVRLAALLVPALAGGLPAQRSRLVAVAGDTRVDLGSLAVPVRVGRADVVLAAAIRWRTVRPGLEVAALDLRAGARALDVEATVVRVDGAHFRFALQHAVRENGMTGRWTIDSAGRDAALAMNAGQFKETGPWGWLVLQGEERRTPGRAPLGIGIRIDTAGRIRWVPPGGERRLRDDPETLDAFQSFPLLFFDRRVPPTLRDGAALRLAHRDARLVLGELDDGRLLVLLTRYAGLGAVAERVPIGLTTPETLTLVAALGARHAVMLDGGVSAQLLVRNVAGVELRRAGLRQVPLGIVAVPRAWH